MTALRAAARTACTVLLAASLCTAAKSAAPGPVNDPGLVARAKTEGAVVLYGSMVGTQMNALAQRFQAQYGIRMETLRLESDQLPGRMLTEQRAGTFRADVVDEPGFQIDQINRQQLLTAYRPPEVRDLLADTFDPGGAWATMFLNTETIAFNPQRLKAANLKPPSDWADLAKPEWRGQFGLFTGSFEWYAAMKRTYGKDKADALMRRFAANGPRMLNSHQLGVTLLEAGEFAGALNMYGYDAARDRKSGQPIDFVNPNPTVIEIHAIAIVRNAPHPNAARLFERWLLSRETQTWVAESLNRISARKDVKNDPAIWNPKIHYLISRPADSVNYAEDVRTFRQIFGLPG